jgi:deoxyribodipyrimidine photolyase-related protein
MAGKTLLVLGDQLSHWNSALRAGDRNSDVVLMVECPDFNAKHHKIVRVFQISAMRHFAEELRNKEWTVDYHALGETTDLASAARKHFARFQTSLLVVMEPNNFSDQSRVERMAGENAIPLEVLPTCQFVVPRAEFLREAHGKKRLIMEQHYRKARQKYGILLDHDGEPEGGAWNFDAENRKTLADWKKDGAPRPGLSATKIRLRDGITEKVISEVDHFFPDGIGRSEDCWLPVTRAEALESLSAFIRERLPRFGDYQDLMLQDSPTLFHSLISGPLNLGLLNPLECVEAAEKAYRQGEAPLAAVEGFIRQILGWREFVNGVYWLKGPQYLSSNALNATRPLPDFFYTAKTDMQCLSLTISEAIDTSYNHHIQRLMILGNFLLLAGIDPQESHVWFLEMYVDAHEWVMAANVLGMALHADGGFMATKPYAGSAAYISKMSNYCSGCQFDPKKKTGPGACPYNFLYWDFYDRHAKRFASNPRTSMMVSSWTKRTESEKAIIRSEARAFLEKLRPTAKSDDQR